MISEAELPPFSELPASTLILSSESTWVVISEQYSKGVHPSDVWQHDPTKPLTMREVRDLHHFAEQTPVGANKLILIFQADLLKAEPANALLKILEEPPSYLKLVLFSESKQVLPTLLSRLRVLTFDKKEISESEFGKWQALVESYNPAKVEDRQQLQTIHYLLPLMHGGIQQGAARDAFSPDK